MGRYGGRQHEGDRADEALDLPNLDCHAIAPSGYRRRMLGYLPAAGPPGKGRRL
jgi:hypothetical protein